MKIAPMIKHSFFKLKCEFKINDKNKQIFDFFLLLLFCDKFKQQQQKNIVVSRLDFIITQKRYFFFCKMVHTIILNIKLQKVKAHTIQ